jgi:hypothetical protein
MSITRVSVGSDAFEAAVAAGADAQLIYRKPARWAWGEPEKVDSCPREVKLLRFDDNGLNVLTIDKAADQPRKFRLDQIVDAWVPSEFTAADVPAASADDDAQTADALIETLIDLSGSEVTITAGDDGVTVTWRVQPSGAALHAPGETLTGALNAALDLERIVRF